MRMICPLLLGITLSCVGANADQRPWVWTYGSAMMHPGEAEFEHYTTLQSPDWTRREHNLKTVHQAEVEIGMAERLDAAVYQVFSRTPGAPLDWDGYKLRLRWRLTENAASFGRPILYLEHANNATLTESGWEAKLLLSQPFGPLEVAVNPVVEFEGGETEFAVNGGFSLATLHSLRLGGELRASEGGVYAGPTLSHGGAGLWSALGVVWRLGEADPGETTHQVRLILGVRVKD